ncbi:hypothetical protein [Myxococcus faecalis]|uniref:hypothetical protein n=1 Tax=Myxococcus faecalis TaxID=3115646 RepID=UPI003CE94F1A
MPDSKTISFRAPLQGEVQDFLTQVGISCVPTTTALVELVVELSHYEEEGKRLFPNILVCNSLSEALGVVQGTEPLTIGRGEKGAATARLALKRCAPLTREAWAMFVERVEEKEFHYGVFRRPLLPTAVDIRETVASLPADTQGVVLLGQVAERIVEVVGPGEKRLLVHLSAAKATDAAPRGSLAALVTAATINCDEACRESLRTYLSSKLTRALVEGHGALIAVVPLGKNIPSVLREDGRFFATPIELAPVIKGFLGGHDIESIMALNSYAALIEGMLGSDGITVLRSDGALLGYNAFVKSNNTEHTALPSQLLGGARRRAFEVLCKLVEQVELACAFMRSSNGSSEHRGGAAR